MDHQVHTIEVYNRHVKEYVTRFMDLYLYKDTFDRLLDFIPARARVLELGCGPGNVISYLRSKRSDLDILGIDLAPRMIQQAQIMNPGSRFEIMDIRNATRFDQEFDVLISAFSLPYIPRTDVPQLFRNFKKLSASNAILYLSCMEGSMERSGYEKTSFTGDDELYINYYERDEITSWLNREGFTIKSFFTKDYPERDGSTTTDLIFIARAEK